MKAYSIPTSENKDYLTNILLLIKAQFADNVVDMSNTEYNTTITVNKSIIVPLLSFIRDDGNMLFSQLIDITAVDNPENEKRFDVIYNLLSMSNNARVQILVSLAEYEEIESASNVFSSALWLEREVWDLFGISFINHPNLIRLLNDFSFSGHPLRKDFPVTGYNEVYYNASSGKVEYKKLELSQAYRNFNYQNPWLDNIEAETFEYLNKNKNKNSEDK